MNKRHAVTPLVAAATLIIAGAACQQPTEQTPPTAQVVAAQPVDVAAALADIATSTAIAGSSAATSTAGAQQTAQSLAVAATSTTIARQQLDWAAAATSAAAIATQQAADHTRQLAATDTANRLAADALTATAIPLATIGAYSRDLQATQTARESLAAWDTETYNRNANQRWQAEMADVWRVIVWGVVAILLLVLAGVGYALVAWVVNRARLAAVRGNGRGVIYVDGGGVQWIAEPVVSPAPDVIGGTPIAPLVPPVVLSPNAVLALELLRCVAANGGGDKHRITPAAGLNVSNDWRNARVRGLVDAGHAIASSGVAGTMLKTGTVNETIEMIESGELVI